MAFHNIPPNGFPDIPDMEELEAVVKDVASLKTGVAGLATDVSNLSDNKANQITIAPFFNPEASYDPGDLVYYNGLSYRCVNAHEGEWDADDFSATTIDNELGSLRSGLIVYFDSDELTFTDIANNANQNQTVTNFNVPSGYTVITRDVLITNITDSWNILVSFLNRYNTVSVHNYGTNANTVKVVVRSLCVKSGG